MFAWHVDPCFMYACRFRSARASKSALKQQRNAIRTSHLLFAAALLALVGCDSTSRTTTNSSTSPTTVARPSYDSAASSSPAGDGDLKPTTKLAPASTDK